MPIGDLYSGYGTANEREINTVRPRQPSPMFSAMRPEPTKERLDAPSTRVWVKNTSEKQNHIVIDRFNVGHELRPGERREMEMINSEIEALMEHRKPERYFPQERPEDPPKLKPLHPILIEGLPEPAKVQEPERMTKRGDQR